MHCDSIHGFSFIEVLISLLLLSLLVFLVHATGFSMLQDMRSAYYLHIAVNQMNNISERLRSLGEKEGLTNQIESWKTEIQMLLPQGSGQVSGFYPTYTVFITWGEVGATVCQQNKIGRSGCLKETIYL